MDDHQTSQDKKPLSLQHRKGRSGERGILWRLFLTCWLIYGLHFATNTVREIYPALSLGDALSFDVSDYLGLHPDIFEIPGRGAFINNNPGASILGTVPYMLTRPVTDYLVERVQRARAASQAPPPEYDTIYPMAREFFQQAYARGLDIKFGLAAGIMQIGLMAPLSALSVVVMYQVLRWRDISRKAALWMAILYAFATPIFYRTATLNHNVLQAHFAFFAFVMLWRPWDESGSHHGRPGYFLAGLLAGWTVVLDYSGVILLLALGLYAIVRRRALPITRRRSHDLPAMALGAGLALAVLAGYQWVNFGNPWLPAQNYMPETTFSGRGYQGIDWPQLDLFWLNAFSIRYGLFTSAPLLILAWYVPGWLRSSPKLVALREIGFIIGVTLAMFTFTAANQFSRMQFNSGVRHMVPVTPFLFLLVAGVLMQTPKKLAILTGIITTYWSWCLSMYRDVEQGRGVLEALIHITTEGVRLPWLTTLSRLGLAPGWLSAWLVLLLAALLIAAIWTVNRRNLQALLPSWLGEHFHIYIHSEG